MTFASLLSAVSFNSFVSTFSTINTSLLELSVMLILLLFIGSEDVLTFLVSVRGVLSFGESSPMDEMVLSDFNMEKVKQYFDQNQTMRMVNSSVFLPIDSMMNC